MIKRRFYKLEHGDRDAPSESSSSDDSELEAVSSDDSDEEEEAEEDLDSVKVREKDEDDLGSSGYESEDSSAHEINLDSSGLPTSDEEAGSHRDGSHPSDLSNTKSFVIDTEVVTEQDDKDLLDLPDCVVKHKSVYKCQLCPKIVCLSRETLDAHLKSKRHARSEKLLKEGRLKHMLDPDDRIEDNKSDEDDQEIAPAVAFAEPKSGKSRKEKRASRGQKSGSNKKPERLSSKNGRISMKSRDKRRRYDSD